MNITRKKVLGVLITLFSIVLGVVWLTPLIWLIGTALTETTFHMTFLPTTPFTLDNIKYVWNAVPFGQYYLNTLLLVVGTFCIQFVTSTLAAYSLAFYKFKGQALVFIVIFMQIIIPNDVLIIPNFMTLSACTTPSWASCSLSWAARWPSSCCASTSRRCPRRWARPR